MTQGKDFGALSGAAMHESFRGVRNFMLAGSLWNQNRYERRVARTSKSAVSRFSKTA
jgi:hypothetical protein